MNPAVRQVQIRDVVERIADAVLYEGYILYPYRPSAVKNQQRWNFGVVCPNSYAEAQRGTENSSMQTECLVSSDSDIGIDIKIRFLHLLLRQVCRVVPTCNKSIEQCGHVCEPSFSLAHFELVPSMICNGAVLQTWQEAIEREVLGENLRLDELQTKRVSFGFPAASTNELLFDNQSGELAGLLIRRQEAINGMIEISASSCVYDKRLRQLTVRIDNETEFEVTPDDSRDEALLKSFVSTHTILRARAGEFMSLLDPPEFAREAASSCVNRGTYPVLAGEENSRDCMLSSPIILYDYPQVATESAGDLFDGTEIDEILTLRIMTLTEEEKREIRDADDRARAILERTESLPAEQFLKLHGAMKRI